MTSFFSFISSNNPILADDSPKRPSLENIPTVQVSGLGCSRRLSSTLEKSKVLQMSDADVERLLRSFHPGRINTPTTTTPSPRLGGLPDRQSPMPGDTISPFHGSETIYNHVRAVPASAFGYGNAGGHYRPDVNSAGEVYRYREFIFSNLCVYGFNSVYLHIFSLKFLKQYTDCCL